MIEAIAKIGNCQRIQIEGLLFRRFGLNNSISAIFGNTGNFGNRTRFKGFRNTQCLDKHH
jgi:hypothetical protein